MRWLLVLAVVFVIGPTAGLGARPRRPPPDAVVPVGQRARDYRIQSLRFRGFATAINEIGQVVGIADVRSDNERAVLWDNGVLTEIAAADGGTAFPSAINDLGQVVGWAETAERVPHAFLWQNGVMMALTNPGVSKSGAFDINNRG